LVWGWWEFRIWFGDGGSLRFGLGVVGGFRIWFGGSGSGGGGGEFGYILPEQMWKQKICDS